MERGQVARKKTKKRTDNEGRMGKKNGSETEKRTDGFGIGRRKRIGQRGEVIKRDG